MQHICRYVCNYLNISTIVTSCTVLSVFRRVEQEIICRSKETSFSTPLEHQPLVLRARQVLNPTKFTVTTITRNLAAQSHHAVTGLIGPSIQALIYDKYMLKPTQLLLYTSIYVTVLHGTTLVRTRNNTPWFRRATSTYETGTTAVTTTVVCSLLKGIL